MANKLETILNEALIKRRDLTYKLMFQTFMDELPNDEVTHLNQSKFKDQLEIITIPKANELANHNIKTIFDTKYYPKIKIADAQDDDEKVNELSINGVIATFDFKYKQAVKAIIKETYQRMKG